MSETAMASSAIGILKGEIENRNTVAREAGDAISFARRLIGEMVGVPVTSEDDAPPVIAPSRARAAVVAKSALAAPVNDKDEEILQFVENYITANGKVGRAQIAIALVDVFQGEKDDLAALIQKVDKSAIEPLLKANRIVVDNSDKLPTYTIRK